jgi:hypothetical protein
MRSEEYEDAEGNVMITNGENIVISNQCLIVDIDIDGESTIDCSHFEVDIDIDGESTIDCSHFEPINKNEGEDFPLLKHLR